MGVYINMEMPIQCGECPFSLYPHSPCWKNGGAVDWENRPNWCPLIKIPPHGDLIERDALDVIGYCDIPQGYEDTFDDGVMWLAEQIDLLPTIIPAEEGEI